MFNLNTASIEVRKIAARSGIRAGKWEPENEGASIDYLVDEGMGDTVVAKVWNRNKSIEITANDIVDANFPE